VERHGGPIFVAKLKKKKSCSRKKKKGGKKGSIRVASKKVPGTGGGRRETPQVRTGKSGRIESKKKKNKNGRGGSQKKGERDPQPEGCSGEN